MNLLYAFSPSAFILHPFPLKESVIQECDREFLRIFDLLGQYRSLQLSIEIH